MNETRSASRIEPDITGLTDALAQLSFVVTAVLSRIAAEHDLSLTQLRVLAILSDRRVRMSELASYLGLDRSTMSGLIDRAEKRALVKRAPSATDGRAVDVFLSANGQELAATLFTQISATLTPMTDSLTPPEQRRLENLLRSLLTSRE